MGLTIFLQADNQEALYATMTDDDHRRYSLSRTFCNFMCRQHVANSKPELDQIGELTGIDIQPLYVMETHPEPSWLEGELENAEDEEERQQIMLEAKAAKASLTGNIDKVAATVAGLLSKLATVDNLPDLMDAGRPDTLDNLVYFADFLREAGNGDIDYLYNNFGQDLRAFQRFLDFARSHGSAMVYFEYA